MSPQDRGAVVLSMLIAAIVGTFPAASIAGGDGAMLWVCVCIIVMGAAGLAGGR